MKLNLKYLIIIGLLVSGLAFMMFTYFGGYKFDPKNTEFTLNLKNKEFQPIYLDNVLGATKMVVASTTELTEVDSLGNATIKEMKVKLIKLSGIGSPSIKYAQFDGNTMILFFAPGDTNKEIKVNLPKDGIVFNTEVSVSIISKGYNLSDLLNNKELITDCVDFLGENGLIDNSNFIEGDCLDQIILNEAGRICNGKCLHE